MFRRLPDPGLKPVMLSIDGEPVTASQTDSVAAALLASGRVSCRTTAVSRAARAPYCMMGVCFDCLVTIDGEGNRQACLVRVREGMRVETQQGKREAGR